MPYSQNSPWTSAQALAKIMQRLNYSELSRQAALTYLLRRGCPVELAETTLNYCQERNFINDQRLINLLSEKGQRQGWSQQRLQQEALKLKLPSCGQLSEEQSCHQLAERWLQRGLDPKKIAMRLQRRGFNYSLIRQVVDLDLITTGLTD